MKTIDAYDDGFASRKGKFSVPLLMRLILGNGPIRGTPASKERLNIRRFLAGMVLTMLIAIPKISYAIAGIEGTFEYAFDAPWRLEPRIAADGTLVYGNIPIQLSIHDAMHSALDTAGLPRFPNVPPVVLKAPATLGNICGIAVHETQPNGRHRVTHFSYGDLAEVEATWGTWKPPNSSNANLRHETCRLWDGSPCTEFRNVGPTSEWHGLLWYRPWREMLPGTVIPLGIEMELTRDGGDLCDVRNAANRITLYNALKVYLGDAPLPRFGDGWLYGDLHYHSQGSDNEGESGYNYRGVIRTMGALGLDFVFATDHASNSEQIIDADLSFKQFELDFHDVRYERGVLRDMSAQRFSTYYDLIYGIGGVNQQAAFETGSGHLPQGFISHGVVPQLFLGGELDVIPEVAKGFPNWEIPYGNGLNYNLINLCGGWQANTALGNPCAAAGFIWEYVPATNDYLIHDMQGINGADYGRLHLIYLPKRPDKAGFVPSDTGKYGGAGRRLADPHQGKPSVLSDIEQHGYAFIAHHMTAPEPGTQGPDGVPWSEHLLRKAWASPAILGLEFWNEDTRLRDKIELGDEVGYGRYEGKIGSYSDVPVPVDFFREGFNTGVFELYPHHYLNGVWDEVSMGVEKTLAHGAYSWDRINLWGLDVNQTNRLAWLACGEPRRFFVAGGSDAHGDFNYRREGYFTGTTGLTDTAIGKPRNLVYAGAPERTFDPPCRLAPVNRSSSDNSGTSLLNRSPNNTSVLATSSDSSRLSAFGQSTAPNNNILAPINSEPKSSSGTGSRYPQEQIVATLAEGHFSVTDGPALRIVVDRNRNGIIDGNDIPMGGIVDLYGDKNLENLPLLVEWRSTPEFGPVSDIHIYLGVHATDISTSRLYAPQDHGPSITYPYLSVDAIEFLEKKGIEFPTPIHVVSSHTSNGLTYALMSDNYWRDPTGALTIPLPVAAYEGVQAVELNLGAYQVAEGREGERFFVRAFAQTQMRKAGDCVNRGTEAQRNALRSGQCIRRYALTNPIWAIKQTFTQCPVNARRAIDGDGDGFPDGCDPCPKSKVNVCAGRFPGGGILAPSGS
jgi:hypothetical protein